MPLHFLFLRTDPQQRHGNDDEEEVDGFGLDVLFFEEDPATQEAHEDAGTTYERGDRDQCIGIRERVEVTEVGHREENGDEGYLPRPVERMFEAMSLRCPTDQADDAHHQDLIEVVPRLDNHLVKASVRPDAKETLSVVRGAYQELVIKAGDGSEDRTGNDHPDPDTVLERDSFFLATATDERKGDDRDQDTGPLPRVEFFAEDKDGTEQDKDWTGSIDR